jgi:hypothetical protein
MNKDRILKIDIYLTPNNAVKKVLYEADDFVLTDLQVMEIIKCAAIVINTNCVAENMISIVEETKKILNNEQ